MRSLVPVLILLSTSLAVAQPVIESMQGVEDEQPNIAPRGIGVMSGEGFGGPNAEVKVFVNGNEAFVVEAFRTDEDLVFLVPPETPVGPATFTMRVDGVTSAPFAYNVDAFAPFIADLGDAFHLDGSVVDEFNPAVPGETVKVTLLTGLGANEPPQLSVSVDGLPADILALEDEVEPLFLDGVYTMTAVVPAGLAPGFYPGLFEIGGTQYLTSGFLEVGPGAISAPTISVGGVVLSNLLPSVKTISPLSIISLFGANFSNETILFPNLDGNGDLETILGGACVEIASQRSPIFAVTPTQLNVQTPGFDVLGPVAVVVIRNCNTPLELRSPVEMVTVEEATPGFFLFPPLADDGLIAARYNDTAIAVAPHGLFTDSFGTSRPAVPGDIVLLFGSGWGETDPSFATGELATGAASCPKPTSR
ncbi:MAG: hypothetical protein O3A53_21180 [Acidobacteria bacterium]|nr:hypothetical protein [Acidobacteriota bacterium]